MQKHEQYFLIYVDVVFGLRIVVLAARLQIASAALPCTRREPIVGVGELFLSH